jgi:hypothetical protein
MTRWELEGADCEREREVVPEVIDETAELGCGCCKYGAITVPLHAQRKRPNSGKRRSRRRGDGAPWHIQFRYLLASASASCWVKLQTTLGCLFGIAVSAFCSAARQKINEPFLACVG